MLSFPTHSHYNQPSASHVMEGSVLEVARFDRRVALPTPPKKYLDTDYSTYLKMIIIKTKRKLFLSNNQKLKI